MNSNFIKLFEVKLFNHAVDFTFSLCHPERSEGYWGHKGGKEFPKIIGLINTSELNVHNCPWYYCHIIPIFAI